jgi:hypothetical protein
MKVTLERVSEFNLRNLLGYDTPEDIVRAHADCIRRSNCIWLGRADGIDACAFGLIPPTLFSTEPYLWSMHTRLCEQHPLLFVRWSRKAVAEILDLYPSVIGLCHCDNDSGRRWLEWLGARFDSVRATEHLVGFRIMRNG